MAPFRRPLGTFHQQLRRPCGIVTAKQNIGSTYFFLEEQFDGSPEELFSLVPVRVQQRRKKLLQGWKYHLQCDRHVSEPIMTTR